MGVTVLLTPATDSTKTPRITKNFKRVAGEGFLQSSNFAKKEQIQGTMYLPPSENRGSMISLERQAWILAPPKPFCGLQGLSLRVLLYCFPMGTHRHILAPLQPGISLSPHKLTLGTLSFQPAAQSSPAQPSGSSTGPLYSNVYCLSSLR